MCIHVHIYIYFLFMHVYILVHSTYICTYIERDKYTYVCIYVYIYLCIYIYMNTYISETYMSSNLTLTVALEILYARVSRDDMARTI